MKFGYEEINIERLGAKFTANEIRQQPDLWIETYNIILKNKKTIEDYLKKNLKDNTRIVLSGAGTSAYIGDTVKPYLSKVLKQRVEAIATTTVVSNPEEYIETDTQTILVSFARSGNSPESVGTYDLFENNVKYLSQVVITCNSNGELAKRAGVSKNNLVLLMPEESNDKSFAMTSSFTCMMLAVILLFDINNLEKNISILDEIVKNGNKILDSQWKDIRDIVDYNCDRVVYLGSGSLEGLSKEMALKNLELTSGKITTVCESVLGFRHGPKSIINDNTLVIILTSNNKYTNLYDMDLIKEISSDSGEHKIVTIAYKGNEELKNISDKYITINGNEINDVYASLNYVLYGQMLGLLYSLKLGICPDNPRPSGTVNRVVKGVVIHNYK